MDMGLSGAEEANELPPAISAGIRQFGDYELLEEVGRGGMGVVYRARQISLNRIVAVKMLVARPFAVPELEERLHLEAEAAAGLNHPNIVTIFEFGECDDQFYFSMEYIEGRSLAQLTRHHSLAPTQAAQYVKAVAEAVHHAHEHGILHRDLKPSNILIDQHDQVKVTDFGLAKRLGTDSELTLTGQLVGSPNYLSPEQAAGKHRALTVRSDVYSLGAVLYQLLTARPPLVGESLEETLVQIREKEAPSPRLLSSGVPRDLETICLKCLQKEPARRYGSAQALAADLGRFLERKPISARPVSAAGRVWRWCRRKPALAGALAGCALALLAGIIGIAWQWKRAEAEAQVARRNLYGADMLLAQQALEQSDMGRAKELLDQHRPGGKAKTDLRGWEWRYLWSQCQSHEQATLCRESNAVTALAFSANGTQLAVRRDPGIVMLWDAQARRLISEHPASPWFKALAASPTSQLFAWGGSESNGVPCVVLWDASLHREVARLPHTSGAVSSQSTPGDLRIAAQTANEVVSLAFSSDAQWLATLTRHSELFVWDVNSRKVAKRFQIRTNFHLDDGSHYGAVLFSPNSSLLAVGIGEAQVCLLDWVSGAVTNIALSKPANGVSTLAFTPDGKRLALGGGYLDNTIHLFELETGAWIRLNGHKGWIVCLAFAPDGQMLASASADQTLRLWDVPRGASRAPFHGHEDEVYFVAWTRDGRQLVSGGKDGSVRFWEPTAKLQSSGCASLPENTWDLVFTPDSRRVVTMRANEKTLIVRDVRTLQAEVELSSPGYGPRRLALAGDGRRLAFGDRSGNVEIWDLASYQRIASLFVERGWIRDLQFSPTGNQLLCVCERADRRRVVQVYETATWSTVDLAAIHLEDLHKAMLTPNGSTLAVSHRNGMVAWWDLKTRQRQAQFQWPHLGPGVQMAFSRDGRWFAAGGESSVLMLVEVVSRQSRQIVRAHVSQVVALDFSPDGRRLITSGTAGNDTIKIWDVEGGRDIATLAGKPGFYDLIGFSPDGHILYAVDNRGNALFWRAPTLEEITTREQATKFQP